MKRAKRHLTTKSPAQCSSAYWIERLNTDNFHTDRSYIMLDSGDVTIVSQKLGEAPTGEVTLSRADFKKLLRWYQRPQRLWSAKGRRR